MPLDNPLAALPYMGPAWYWIDNAEAIFKYGYSKSGKITLHSFKYYLRASRCMHGAPLETYYKMIENIVSAAMSKHQHYNPLESPDPRPFTEEEVVNEYKGLILAMQGSWTSQHSYSWSVCNARYEEDAPAAVHMWRPNADGSRRMMMRKEVLCNKTMFPIGRIALDLEHLRMFEMVQIIKDMDVPPAIYGCINDCFMLDHITIEEAQDLCDKLKYPDGTPIFKVKEGQKTAPLCKWKYAYDYPRVSSWRAPNEDFTSDTMSREDTFWLSNGRSRVHHEWKEPEGLGLLPDGTYDEEFQEEVANAIVDNEGGLCLGAGGTGKSEIIKRLTKKFEEKGFKDQPSTKYPDGRSRVILCGFTHVAAANLGEDGITVLATLHRDGQRKRSVFIFDEASMISMELWGLIAQLKFTGNIIVILGDFAGQFGPICESSLLEGGLDMRRDKLPLSNFMRDLVNNFIVKMAKYRRGDDYEHFKFTTSIYPEKLAIRYPVMLEDEHKQQALTAARERYPTKGTLCLGTNLVMTNKTRIRINTEVNDWLAPTANVLVKAPEHAARDANQPQDMKIWEGIVLMARVNGMLKIKQANGGPFNLQNGRRYQVVSIAVAEDDAEPEFEFEMACINDKNEKVSETFMMSKQDLAKTMRLTHAFTYYSSQARTIRGDIRLCDTDHRHFTLRHLIVGLGRAPRGDVVQVG